MHIEVRRDARSLEELEAPWRELWNQATSPVIFLHPLWARAWWSHYGQGMELYVVLVWEDGGRLAGIAPMCRSQKDQGALGWIGGTELSDSLDFLIRSGLEARVMAVLEGALRRLLHSTGELDLHYIPEDSATLEEVNDMLGIGWDVRIDLEESSPWVPLPATWEQFLERLSGHHRHEIRRKMGKAQRDLEARFRVIEHGDGWSQAMEHFFRLHRLSQPQKAAFMDERQEAFFGEVAELFQKEGMVRLSELRIQEGPIASALSFVHGSTWALYNSGFDPRYRHYSPGIVHVAHTIQRAIAEGLSVYDFLRGREIYKYDFGARDRHLFRLRLRPRSEERA